MKIQASLYGMELESVVREWNRCHGAFYQVNESDLRWNRERQLLVLYQGENFAGIPVILATASERGVRAGIPAGSLWLSLWGEIPVGRESDFVSAFLQAGLIKQKKRLQWGADEFHFFPGIPKVGASSDRLIEAARSAGFVGADVCDFVGDAENPAAVKYVDEARLKAVQGGWIYKRAQSADDRAELGAFLKKEFQGRWMREFEFWCSAEDVSRAQWYSLRGGCGTVLGFARLAVRGEDLSAEEGWTPGALRLPLRKTKERLGTDGCLGPIGIAASERGKGTGRILLGCTLATLKQHNAKQVCIDWTDAMKYYEPLGFLVTRKYWTAWKTF